MIYIIAGHNHSDPGAHAEHKIGKIKESDLTIELRDLIISYLKSNEQITSIKKDNDDTSLRNVIKYLNENVTRDDLVIDIHFNAFNGKATGTEVIIPNIHSQFEMNIGRELCTVMANTLTINNRGVKNESQTARGKIGILRGKGNRVLIEVCFMDNPSDFNSYKINMYILAAEIASVIAKYYKKL